MSVTASPRRSHVTVIATALSTKTRLATSASGDGRPTDRVAVRSSPALTRDLPPVSPPMRGPLSPPGGGTGRAARTGAPREGRGRTRAGGRAGGRGDGRPGR